MYYMKNIGRVEYLKNYIALEIEGGSRPVDIMRRYGVSSLFVRQSKRSGRIILTEPYFGIEDYLDDPEYYIKRHSQDEALKRRIERSRRRIDSSDIYEIVDSSTLSILRSGEYRPQLISFPDTGKMMAVFNKGLHGDSEVVYSCGNIRRLKRII